MYGSKFLTSWSIPRKLLLLLLIILLPAFGIILSSNLSQRERAIKEAENRSLLLARSLAAQQAQITYGARQILSTLAQLPEVRNLNDPACSELFGKLLEKNPSYCFLGATRPDGSVFASSTPFAPGTNLSDSKYFRDAVRTLDFSIGEYIVGRISKVPAIHFAYPVMGEGQKLAAVLLAGLNLSEYSKFLSRVNLPEGAVVTIADHRGIRLLRFPQSDEIVPGRPINEDAFRRISGERESGTYERTGEDGVYRIYAFEQLRLAEGAPPYLYLIVGNAKEPVVRSANLDILRNLAGLGIVGVLAMMLLWKSANHLLIRPINQLVATTRELGKGKTGARTGLPHTPDELGQLARSFDEMGTLLEIRNRERLRVEKELLEAHDELEAKVRLRTMELARANDSLRISETRYRTLFESASDALFLVRDNRFIDCNMSALKAFGHGRDEVIGSYPYQFAPRFQPDGTDSAEDALRRMSEALSGTPQFFEWKHQRRDGTPFDVDISLNRIEVGGEMLILGLVRDITSRKEAERALKESAYFQQQLIDALPTPVFFKDREGRYLGCNRALESFLKTNKERIIGKTVSEVAPGDLGAAYNAIDTALLQEPGSSVYEASMPHPDRSVRDIIFHKATFPLPDGTPGGLIVAMLDITERKRAENELKKSEERLKILFECAPDPYYLLDLQGNIVDGNRAAEIMIGRPREEVIGKNLLELDLLAPEDVPNAINDLALVGAGQPAGPDEYTIRKQDGTEVFLEARSFPTAVGDQMLVLGIARDITARKRAEDALVESQQQLADIIDFLPDATMVVDGKGKVIAWNRAMEEMVGTPAVDVLGKGNFEYAVPFYGQRRPILMDMLINPSEELETNYSNLKRKGGVLSAETFIPSLRGNGAHLFITTSALYDSRGNVAGAIESIRDITERGLMEKAVIRAEEKYRNIFENSVTGIFQVSMDGRFLQVNTAIAHICGYDSAEELLKNVQNAQRLYVHPERRLELLRQIDEQGVARDFELELFRKDGSIVWGSLNVRAVRDADGGITCMEGTVLDITDSKQLKAQLNQALKMEAIGTLAGGIAHDFNNILAPIIGYTELSLNMLPEDGRLSHNLRQVILSANRAKDLVRQILTFSRRTEREKKPVQVSIIVREALKLLRPSLPTTIEIRRDIRPDAMESTAMADPTQIHQVLMNLCTNAAHAMRAKGGTLAITLENVDFGHQASLGSQDIRSGPYLRLSVADTGHGMDEEVRQRIFDPYFTTKGPNEGTGLGLAVVYGIVKDLSGAIMVFSSPGGGTTFDVYLPRIGEPPRPSLQPRPKAPEDLPMGHGRVLIVDDEKFIVDMMKEMLERLGYEPVPRYSSTDAVEAFRARAESFDLVITDMTMPNMIGTDLAREILAIRPHTPLILCTGFSEKVDEDKIKVLGIRKLLMKPVSMRDLATAVADALRHG